MPATPPINRAPVLMAAGCFVIWGTFPIYWRQLAHLPALEILSHRMIWAFVFYLGIYCWRHWRGIRFMIPVDRKDWAKSIFTMLLLVMNWGIYIYAVNNGHILQGSLAYFINPLMSVAVGVLFFHEPFPRLLKIAFVLALAGVLIQMAYGSEFPWIALTLATSFCVYGVVKKLTRPGATQSSLMEGAAGLLPAIACALWLRSDSTYVLTTLDWVYLLGGGVVTGLPLFMFAVAAKQLPYSLIGMLQFIGPTLQFLVGVFLYNEHLETAELFSFALIWVGVAFYFADRLHAMRLNRRLPRDPMDIQPKVTQ